MSYFYDLRPQTRLSTQILLSLWWISKLRDMRKVQRLTFDKMKEFAQNNRQLGNNGVLVSTGIAIMRDKFSDISIPISPHEPYIMEDSRLGLIVEGSGRYTINLLDKELKKGDFLIITKGTIVQNNALSQDFELYGVAFDDTVIYSATGGHVPPVFLNYRYDIQMRPDKAELELMGQYFECLMTSLRMGLGNSEPTEGIIKSILTYSSMLAAKYKEAEDYESSRAQTLFNEFIRLVNAGVCRHHDVDYYAQSLFLSTGYFGSVIKSVSGVTAKGWIDRALITQAKVMLKHTDKQIVRISEELGFPNPSFFCKYFKRFTGRTPQDYKKT